MNNANFLKKNQFKIIETEKVKQLEKNMSKELIDYELHPKLQDFIFEDYNYELTNGTYKLRDEPLIMFKKKSKFRQWAEKRLKENDLYDNYTILYNFKKEWYDTVSIIDNKKYKNISL
jgi:hypothetical protein